ncbi:MAG: C-GCAxxG-C-C family protein [Candidatus Hodarchaeota archaeon]
MEKRTKEDIVELAKSHAEDGFLCSEAVLLALSDLLEADNNSIPAIATGFGAGIGGWGSVCGAASGAVMGLGLKFGRKTPTMPENARFDRPYWYSKDFLFRFAEMNGSFLCRELTGCDITKQEGLEKYRSENHWKTTCRELIGKATGLAIDILMENSEIKK